MTDTSTAADAPLSKRLRAATTALHETLDARMSGADLFSSRERYGLFLAMQRRFHADIEPLYLAPALVALVLDLPERARRAAIDLDLADLGMAAPAAPAYPVDPDDLPAALGWLYVSEGSSLGAAFLLKAAGAIGLDEGFGARHLAAHPDGRGLNWRRFAEALDAVALTEAERVRAEAAAVAAFTHVQALAEETLTGGEAVAA